MHYSCNWTLDWGKMRDMNLPKKEKCPKNGCWIKNQKFSKKSNWQSQKVRGPLFYDFLHFKGSSYLNLKISFNLRVHVAILLFFHNPFKILFHILRSALDDELKLDNFLNPCSVRRKSSKLELFQNILTFVWNINIWSLKK